MRKNRETNGFDCSDLGPDEYENYYEKDKKGGYKRNKNGKKIKKIYMKKQMAEKYLYFVGIDKEVIRRDDNHEQQYFQLNDEFVLQWL